ncbi:MAG: methyl-accepting chemotaxis protein, partial [Desulfobulbaceae bacterium]|nr:methyl-accepting chemotaxis protein [Desulfobulbaceae bacterium]
MKLGVKFALGVGVVLFLLIVVIGIYYSTVKNVIANYSQLMETEVRIGGLSREVDSLMLQCRRNEKDFLLRKDKKYLEKMTVNSSRLIAKAEAIIELADTGGHAEISKKAHNIISLITSYQGIFANVVARFEEMGLDHTSGIQGRFRDVVHELDEDLKDHQIDTLYTDLLFMRRWEKDFMRTGAAKYKERLTKSIADYKKDLESSTCEKRAKEAQAKALVSYESAYGNLLKSLGNEKKKQAFYGEMRAAAHTMEGAIKGVLIPNVREGLLEIRKHEKDFLLRRDMKYVAKLEKSAKGLIQTTENSTVEQEHVDAVKNKIAEYLQAFSELVAADKEVQTGIAEMRDIVHQVEPEIAAILEEVSSLEEEKSAATSQNALNRSWISLVLGALSVVFGTLITLFLVRSIIGPIQKAVAFAGEIARGDLTRSLEVTSHDEIGDLTEAMNTVVEKLSAMIRDINTEVSTLESSASDMSGVAAQMTSSSEETVAKANTMAAAAEEMTGNMDSIAAAMEESTSNVNAVAAATEEMSSNIGDISRRANEANENTREAVDKAGASVEMISELGQATEEIGMVTETIAAISDKTNLLALNATIEAARAGEAGKGFAVVASEIKDLAQQTAEATTDISGKLKGIQSSTAGSVTGINEIADVIRQVDETVAAISESMEQQNNATTEISGNVSQTSQGLKE